MGNGKEPNSTSAGRLSLYEDLLANVRYDGEYHPVKALVQPNDPTVKAIARVLVNTDDFIEASQQFVDSFTTYRNEVGDYWAEPGEILERQYGDCDDKAILLTSILRNHLPADQVFCAFGLWFLDGEITGHMYVVTEGKNGYDRIIEATAGPGKVSRGTYVLYGLFNDKLAFSTDIGLREFNLKEIEYDRDLVGRY